MAGRKPLEKILVAVSGTESSITAAQYAICLARVTGGELIAVYVVDTATLKDLLNARIFVPSESLEYERDLEEDGRRYLNYVTKLGKQKGVSVRSELGRGNVDTEVLRVALEHHVDLIVLGEMTQMLSRLEAQRGHSERILYEAPCCVLIVKDEELVTEMYDNL